MWPNPQETADLVTFNDEILNGKLHFLCRVCRINPHNIMNKNVSLYFLQQNIYTISSSKIKKYKIINFIIYSLKLSKF